MCRPTGTSRGDEPHRICSVVRARAGHRRRRPFQASDLDDAFLLAVAFGLAVVVAMRMKPRE
jgi:hypothetical protein